MTSTAQLDNQEGIRWGKVVPMFLGASSRDPVLAAYLLQFCETNPSGIVERLHPEIAEHNKRDTTAFLVGVIKHAVDDHVLSDRELQELRHVSRLLRVEEGELVEHHARMSRSF
jgi:hypothetical protein